MHSWAAQGASAPLLLASPADSIRAGADASLRMVCHCWGRPSLAPPWRSWSEFAPTWCSFWSFVCLQSLVPPDSSLSFLTLSSALRIGHLRSVLRKSPWMLRHHLLGCCLVNLPGFCNLHHKAPVHVMEFLFQPFLLCWEFAHSLSWVWGGSHAATSPTAWVSGEVWHSELALPPTDVLSVLYGPSDPYAGSSPCVGI